MHQPNKVNFHLVQKLRCCEVVLWKIMTYLLAIMNGNGLLTIKKSHKTPTSILSLADQSSGTLLLLESGL